MSQLGIFCYQIKRLVPGMSYNDEKEPKEHSQIVQANASASEYPPPSDSPMTMYFCYGEGKK